MDPWGCKTWAVNVGLEVSVRVEESAAEREATEDTSDEVTVVVTEAGEDEEKLGRLYR